MSTSPVGNSSPPLREEEEEADDTTNKKRAAAAPTEDLSREGNNEKETASRALSSPTSQVEDAPSELAVDRIVDLIDFEIEHILWERMSRKDHFDTLEVSCRQACTGIRAVLKHSARIASGIIHSFSQFLFLVCTLSVVLEVVSWQKRR